MVDPLKTSIHSCEPAFLISGFDTTSTSWTLFLWSIVSWTAFPIRPLIFRLKVQFSHIDSHLEKWIFIFPELESAIWDGFLQLLSENDAVDGGVAPWVMPFYQYPPLYLIRPWNHMPFWKLQLLFCRWSKIFSALVMSKEESLPISAMFSWS